jgi:putative ABC transport system permease protein
VAIPLGYSLGNLATRKVTTILTAGGMALVTFVLAAVLMLAQGLESTLVDTGSAENLIVLRASAETEVASVVDRLSASIVEMEPEVARDQNDDPIASRELVVLVTLPKKGTDKPSNVSVRGVGSHAFELRPQVKLIAGRIFRPGSHEVIAGKSISKRTERASLGDKLRFALTDWQVVGIFDAGKTAFDSEVWGDAEQLMSAFRRTDYSAIILRVPGRDPFENLKNRLENDPRLSVQVKREPVFYREQSEVMAKFIRILGLAMTLFFSIGAILGAMVTMYAAVANRVQEIGTLRALGFRKWSILAAFLSESLLLGFGGGLAGIAAASLLQFLTISTMNWMTFSELAFGFDLTLPIAAYSLGFSLGMGFVGGLLPAWRAARLSIVDSLRAA